MDHRTSRLARLACAPLGLLVLGAAPPSAQAPATPPAPLLVADGSQEVQTLRLPLSQATAEAVAARLGELLRLAPEAVVVEEEGNLLALTGVPSILRTAERVVRALDVPAAPVESGAPVAQVRIEALLVDVDPARSGVALGWLESPTWTPDAVLGGEGDGYRVISAPAITTVVDRKATIRDGTRVPADDPLCPGCPPVFHERVIETSVVPVVVGDDLVLMDVEVRWSTPEGQAEVRHQAALASGEHFAFWLPREPGDEDDAVLAFLTPTIAR